MAEQEFLTRKQALERRRIEIYQHPAFTNKGDPLHKSLSDEKKNIDRELAGSSRLSRVFEKEGV